MKRYLRPLGILCGPAARLAIAEGQALPLAGGPLAFSLAEIIERDDAGQIARRIVRADDPIISSSFPPTGLAKGQPEDRLRRESSESRVGGHMSLFRAAARNELDSRLRGNDGGMVVMGIVNVTPDSFFDGGAFFDPDAAIAHASALIDAGAGMIDIGGESTRPGATEVAPEEEIRRVVPVIAGIRSMAQKAGVVISIDTRNAATMQAARDAGAGLINDVSALTHDPAALSFVAASGLPVVLMHMRGNPGTMQQAPAYGDVVLDVYDYLEGRIAAAVDAGIALDRIVIDPGIGFGKTVAQNLALIDGLSLFHGLGAPILAGVSRKRFIAHLSGDAPPDRRLGGSLAAGLAAAGHGAQILRVHDVAETIQAVRIAAALWDS
jgi:dihydropteroate synthase